MIHVLASCSKNEIGFRFRGDRFHRLVKQGYGRGLDLRALRTMNDWATGKLAPQLTLLFDVPVSVGLSRRRGRGATQNRLDRETERFHRKVRAGFHTLAQREPRRIMMIDSTQPLESVGQTVEKLVMTRFKTSLRRTSSRQ